MDSVLIEEYKVVIDALLKANVAFMLIGGIAVIAHGYARSTSDLDFWIKPDNAQKEQLKNALISIGYDAEEMSVIDDFDFTQHVVFSLNFAPNKIDFITRINLVNFDEAYSRKEGLAVDGIVLPVIHLQDLVLSKFNTGRPQDAADISRLQDIAKHRKNKGDSESHLQL